MRETKTWDKEEPSSIESQVNINTTHKSVCKTKGDIFYLSLHKGRERRGERWREREREGIKLREREIEEKRRDKKTYIPLS